MIYQLGDRKPEILGRTHFIADSADIIGSVLIHDRVSIWFNAVLRGDLEYIEVGEGSNIQDCAVIHTDERLPAIIGENCTIAHCAVVHGCRIGDNTLVGMSATILSGVVVGKNCIIGAGSLVPQGTEIPDNSLFNGVPGQVIKTLTPLQRELLLKASSHYSRGIDDYNRQLKAVDPESIRNGR